MSSYLAPNNIPALPDFQPTIPLELLMKAGMMHESEYDANQAALQSQVDQLGRYPIVKASDRDIVNKKMDQLVNNINDYSGQDLGNSQVYNNVLNTSRAITSDTDLTDRIAANHNYVTQVKKIQKHKDDGDGLYGANNEAVFNAQASQWLSNPKKATFSGTYTPYYDKSDEVGDIVDRIYNAPDIKYGQTIGPDGKPRPYTQQEIEQVTAKRIKDELDASLSPAAKAQMGIDYQASLLTPEKSLQGTKLELGNHINYLNSAITGLKTLLPNITDKESHAYTEQMIKDHEDELKAYNDKFDKVVAHNDPTIYHTQQKFNDDELTATAKGYAYRQEGKPEYDQLFLLDRQIQGKLAVAAAKAKAQKAMATEFAPINTFEKGWEGLHANGEGEFSPEQVAEMQNFGGKINKDGTIDASIGDKEQILDLQPTLDQLHIKLPAQKVMGYGPVMGGYAAWRDLPENKGYKMQMAIVGKNPDGTPETQFKPVYPDVSWENYVKTLTNTPVGKAYIDAVKQKFGLDMTNANDMEGAKAMSQDHNIINAINSASTIMSKAKIRGNVNLSVGQGANTVLASDGNPYNRFNIMMDKKDVDNVYGSDGWFQDKGSKILENGNIIANTGNYRKDNNGKPLTDNGTIYNIPIIMKATKPVNQVAAELINKDKILAKHAGEHYEHWQNTSKLIDYVNQTSKTDYDGMHSDPNEMMEKAIKNVNDLVKSGELNKTYATDYENRIRAYAARIATGDAHTKIVNRALLKAFITSDKGSTLANNLQFLMDASARLKVTTKPTDNMYPDSED